MVVMQALSGSGGSLTRVIIPGTTSEKCLDTNVDIKEDFPTPSAKTERKVEGQPIDLVRMKLRLKHFFEEMTSNMNSLLANSGKRISDPELNTKHSASSNVGIDNVDSIILIYDLDRVETFFRLENHWLPLIERCYNGEVSLSIDFAPLSLIVDSFA